MTGLPSFGVIVACLVINALWLLFFKAMIASRPSHVPHRLWALACLVVIYGIPLFFMISALMRRGV
jgi:hypothetical protein